MGKKKNKKIKPEKGRTTDPLDVEDNPLGSPLFDPIGTWTGIPYIAPSDMPTPEQDADDL